jgi:hypothetical protein
MPTSARTLLPASAGPHRVEKVIDKVKDAVE